MKVLILLALVACTTACGILQRYKVKGQWSRAFGEGADRESFGLSLFETIFNRGPDARSFFRRVNGDDIHSSDFTAHIQRVLGGLDMSISLMDDEPTLNAQFAHLKTQHDAMGIPHQGFEMFKRATMKTVATELGACFDSYAWDKCFDVIVQGISPNA